jgi:hypothetical protein
VSPQAAEEPPPLVYGQLWKLVAAKLALPIPAVGAAHTSRRRVVWEHRLGTARIAVFPENCHSGSVSRSPIKRPFFEL